MTWYNNFVNEANYWMFCSDKNNQNKDLNRPFDLLYEEELAAIGGKKVINKEKSIAFKGRLDSAWRIMSRLLKIDGIFIDEKCHLEGFKGSPSYRACFYIGLSSKNCQGNDILNISVKGGDISIEFRNPVEGNFSADSFLRKFNWYGDGKNIGWINGLPAISIRKFFGVSESGIASIEISDKIKYELLIEIISEYIINIIYYCSQGGSLRTYGQSKGEVVLLKDIEKLFSCKKNGAVGSWLLHGDRPVNNGARSLELDIQIFLKINNSPVSLAIEVQGRHHYPDLSDPLRGYIDLKHRKKIEYCKTNNMIFIWLDWGALDKCFIKNKGKERSPQERLDIVSEFMNKSISAYNAGCRYLEVQKDGNGFAEYSHECNDKNLFTEYAKNYS